jgi:hypothetical protein
MEGSDTPMPAAVRLLEQPERSFLEAQEDPDLDRGIAEAHDRLAAHMQEITASGLLLDPGALGLLRTYATDALSVAITYRRRVGPCGYGCRHPGLHCPTVDPLPTLLAALAQDGWSAHTDARAAQAAAAFTCVCGDRMHPTSLRRGRRRRAWAVCGTCEHWVALVRHFTD